jgi:hypothetical protein
MAVDSENSLPELAFIGNLYKICSIHFHENKVADNIICRHPAFPPERK